MNAREEARAAASTVRTVYYRMLRHRSKPLSGRCACTQDVDVLAMQPDFDCHNEGFTVLPPVPHGTKFNKIKLLGFGTLIAVSDL